MRPRLSSFPVDKPFERLEPDAGVSEVAFRLVVDLYSEAPVVVGTATILCRHVLVTASHIFKSRLFADAYRSPDPTSSGSHPNFDITISAVQVLSGPRYVVWWSYPGYAELCIAGATPLGACADHVRDPVAEEPLDIDAFVAQQPVDLLDAVLAEPAHRLGQTLTDCMDGQRGAGEHAKCCVRKRQDSLRMKVAFVHLRDEFADVITSQYGLLGHRLPPSSLEGAMVIPMIRIGNAARLRPRSNCEMSLHHSQTPTSTGGNIVKNFERYVCSINCASILKQNMRGSLSRPPHSSREVGSRSLSLLLRADLGHQRLRPATQGLEGLLEPEGLSGDTHVAQELRRTDGSGVARRRRAPQPDLSNRHRTCAGEDLRRSRKTPSTGDPARRASRSCATEMR